MSEPRKRKMLSNLKNIEGYSFDIEELSGDKQINELTYLIRIYLTRIKTELGI